MCLPEAHEQVIHRRACEWLRWSQGIGRVGYGYYERAPGTVGCPQVIDDVYVVKCLRLTFGYFPRARHVGRLPCEHRGAS